MVSALALLLIGSVVMIYSELFSRQREKNDFKELTESVSRLETNELMPSKTHENPLVNTEKKGELKNLLPLFEQNNECVGWLTIPDSSISYPVMHTPKEPEKYLRRDFYKKDSQSGVPFIDFRCSITDSNIIIYGHNMKNGTMFSELKKYNNKNFRNSHEIICLQTANGLHKFRVTEVISTNVYDDRYNEIALTGTRKLLLSTCYGRKKTDRLLVIATEAD